MTPARPTAAVLALVASHVTGLMHLRALPSPHATAFFSSSTASVVSHTGATSTITIRRCNHTITRMLMRRSVAQQCRLLPQQRRPLAFRQTARTNTEQLPIRSLPSSSSSLRTTTEKAAPAAGQQQQQQQQAGGPPAGGYPPPDHLHGVFAVYKPKGFSSADVVNMIKRVLTRGAREEINARLALERGAIAPDEEGAAGKTKKAPVEEARVDGVASLSKACQGNHEGPNKKRKKKTPNRRTPGPKVKVGHGGTLDPMATGVLVIGVGKGCRELGNYLKGSKGYRAEGLLGHETTTQDAVGEATVHGEWGHVTKEAVDGVLGQFVGDIMQVPPMFSALHKDGERLYELARKGITVERDPRPVTVYALRQTDPAMPLPLVGLEVECGGGFYVRTLIEDLGRALGSRGHMTALERTKQGPFELEHALRREEWEYDELCKHLGDATEMMARLGLSAERKPEASAAIPGVPDRTAVAVG